MNKSAVIASTETLRYDSEYYLKEYIAIEQLIKRKSEKFSKFSELNLLVDASAFYPALEPFYNTGNYPFIRVGDIKKHVDFENCVKVPFEILHGYPTLKHVKKGDIVLTKGGTIGLAGLITQDCCVTRDLIFINSSVLNERNYIILFLFLSTDFVYKQLIRSGSQSVQPHLTVTLVRNIDVYYYSDPFKDVVAHIYNQSILKLEQSKSIYYQAETLLLSALGINDFLPRTEKINIKSFKDSFLATNRLDAEYYQPKFDELEAQIAKTHELGQLKDLLTLNQRGTQPNYAEQGLPVINSKHVREGEVLLTDNRFATLSDKEEPLFIKKGDVLINGTGVGTIGRSACYLHEQDALPDNHVTILRTNQINPIFLSVYLNSIAGKYQVEKYFKGSSGQIELYPKDIDNFYIPFINNDAQTQIADLVQESFKLKAESERLLAVAKRAVEIAIETDEQAAMDYLNGQTGEY